MNGDVKTKAERSRSGFEGEEPFQRQDKLGRRNIYFHILSKDYSAAETTNNRRVLAVEQLDELLGRRDNQVGEEGDQTC